MCGRYSITTPMEALRKLFNFSGHPNLGPNYHVAPTNIVPFVRPEDGGRELAMARWGFIPSWAKEVRSKPLINARSETVAEKPSFRGAFKYRRCLVPADGYFEWQKLDDGSKQPWYINRADHGAFGMAGIWETYLDPDGTELDTLALMTTSANEKLSALHHRMPVVIGPKEFERWLMTPPEEAKNLLDLLAPAPNDFFTAWPVDRRVGRVGEDDPDIIKPIGPGLDGQGFFEGDETGNDSGVDSGVDSGGAKQEKGADDDQFRLL